MGEGGNPDSTMAGVARQIADSGDHVADRIEQRGPGGLVSDVKNFVRRRPGAFLAGAAVAGFLVGRAEKGVIAAASADSGGSPPGDWPAGDVPPVARAGVPAGYDDLTDAYGQSRPPHVVATPPSSPPAGGPPPYGGSSRPVERM
ncbi:hypothetical protein [Streptomyces sp. NRRL F-2580]|uniref:hypothetical protein n=1 Tax=Streptomyces sp. NRRL F-2580 TaxID=1463841 RepID=UPI00131BEAA7|nr:hypothetical protein [Streptomyces sp. NRRL F-2580]